LLAGAASDTAALQQPYCSMRSYRHVLCCSSCWGSLCRPHLRSSLRVCPRVLLGSLQPAGLGLPAAAGLAGVNTSTAATTSIRTQLHQVAVCTHQFSFCCQGARPAQQQQEGAWVNLGCHQGLFSKRVLKWLSGRGGWPRLYECHQQ
jgi:hypothetical protein